MQCQTAVKLAYINHLHETSIFINDGEDLKRPGGRVGSKGSYCHHDAAVPFSLSWATFSKRLR